MSNFTSPPSPEILHRLAAGQLGNRLHRSVRLWVLLSKLYGSETNWASQLSQPFNYPELRKFIFSERHEKSDSLTAEMLKNGCKNPDCFCQKSMKIWLFNSDTQQSEKEWCEAVMQLTGIPKKDLDRLLEIAPFATVHRSIRDDLKQLAELGWLEPVQKGYYACISPQKWPLQSVSKTTSFANLNAAQIWELLRVLESVCFVQPNLEIIVQSLWESLSNSHPPAKQLDSEPPQRIFIHFDYILSDQMQEQVDNYQEQIEELWRHPPVGVVQFKYWVKEGSQTEVIVYPVCLHYSRRAKYLSAYGLDPHGNIAWHNYRLDRIASKRLKVLAWGDPLVPEALQKMRRAGELPTPEEVQKELDAAWGFNFYLPRELLIIRFPAAFARWYIDNTVRHSTFEPVAYRKLPNLVRSSVKNREECEQILQLIEQKSPVDCYYKAWIRTGDINVLMRLRDWRPNGEVIAPYSVRKQLALEAAQELSHYQDLGKG